MDRIEYIKVKQQIKTLKEVAEVYKGKNIDDIISTLQSKIKHYESLI